MCWDVGCGTLPGYACMVVEVSAIKSSGDRFLGKMWPLGGVLDRGKDTPGIPGSGRERLDGFYIICC